ncbi:MAG: dTMP kinase [Bacilli bacterium]
MTSLFVTFEGGEGSGKSTVLDRIVEILKHKNIDHIVTREPGGCDISEKIRNIILDIGNNTINKRTEALLYASSRAQHVEEILKPNLKKQKLVICDRYVDSSIVYQGYARENCVADIYAINEFAMDNIKPDLTIFFDIKPREAFARIKEHNREMNRLDLEKIEFHQKVYDSYMILAKKNNYVMVDATKTIEEVVQNVYDIIEKEMVKRKMCE